MRMNESDALIYMLFFYGVLILIGYYWIIPLLPIPRDLGIIIFGAIGAVFGLLLAREKEKKKGEEHDC